MGSAESKFCVSKNNASKKYIVKFLKVGLRREEADHVCKLLGEQKYVNKDLIRVSKVTPS